MKFHAFKGVYIFLVLPYYLFVIIFAATNNIENAKNLLIVPVLYALWVIITMAKAIKFKYNNDFSGKKSKEEMIVLMLSLTPWVMLPVIGLKNL